LPSGWGFCGGGGNISSFGTFSAGAKEPGGTDLTPMFTLLGNIGTFAMNDVGTHFVFHYCAAVDHQYGAGTVELFVAGFGPDRLCDLDQTKGEAGLVQ
jgi:hypothetical protein